MTRFGLAGVGFMGWVHTLALRRTANARLAAVASRDPAKRAGDWRAIRGNFGPPGEQIDLTGIAAHDSFDALLADPAVDVIDLCVPNHQHEPMAVAALAAGKHVLVEKPIALTLDAADRMVTAAAKAGKLLMVAHVLPCFGEFAFALAAATSGRFGALRAGQFSRVIARPDWSAAQADFALTGGPAIDLHIHDTQFVRTLAGMPTAVSSVGLFEAGAATYLATVYRFGDGPALSSACGATATAGRPFAHGFELNFDRATLLYHSAGIPLTVSHADGRSEQPPVPSDPIDAFAAEMSAAARSVEAGVAEPFLRGEFARDALRLALAEVESARTGLPSFFN